MEAGTRPAVGAVAEKAPRVGAEGEPLRHPAEEGRPVLHLAAASAAAPPLVWVQPGAAAGRAQQALGLLPAAPAALVSPLAWATALLGEQVRPKVAGLH